ncbi:MAG TPA: arsinothricin resistance N-acetyltransferase ArsN1 family B [Coleofasciculaceae cyanobacterium]|jgi:phosphinothricin acetyltransferase
MLNIRFATEADAPALLQIYSPYIEQTVVSFETKVPSLAEFAARISKVQTAWAWLVAEENGEVCGYAYASSHRERPAYRWSVETSVYIQETYQRRGIAKALYSELFVRLSARGYCNAFAGITLPNEASIVLHRDMGFEPVGVFKRVGRKFGQWQDVAWFQRQLRDIPLTSESGLE